ncbi:MAG: AMP-binding protein [Planctomycetaceae bacterium]|nr:AMP-binding protein [Planctomycetaceae bacterium]
MDSPVILTGDRAALTWDDLNLQLSAAQNWCARCGIDGRDRIAFALPDGPELAVATICFSSVAACAPLNPSCRRPEFDFYLSDLQATVLIVCEGHDTPARDVAKNLGLRIVDVWQQPVPRGVAGELLIGGAGLARGYLHDLELTR